MRYGLLALSLAMLTSGGLAAQSALEISRSAGVKMADQPRAITGRGGSAVSPSRTTGGAAPLRFAARSAASE